MTQEHPQQPRKHGFGKIAGLGCVGVIALLTVVGVATSGGSGGSGDTGGQDRAATAHDGAAGDGKAASGRKEAVKEEGRKDRTQAEEFRACVAKSGTPTEKEAVAHVTKVTGADRRNDVLDTAEVFTDFSGGMMGPHQGEGKLIASAFGSCHESDNGLVTVYDKDGEILSNANY
jgi:hypothetical protein